jgi:hypothetical protein
MENKRISTLIVADKNKKKTISPKNLKGHHN